MTMDTRQCAAGGCLQFLLLLLACSVMDAVVGMRGMRASSEVATLLKTGAIGSSDIQACPPVPGYEVYQGRDHPGDDIGDMIIQEPGTPAGPSTMADLCSRTELCRAFTWRADSRMGSIKSAASPRMESPHGASTCFYVAMPPTRLAIGLPLPDVTPLKSCADSRDMVSYFIDTVALGEARTGSDACMAYGMTCVHVLDHACMPLDCASSTGASRMVECLSRPVDCSGPCDATVGRSKFTQRPGVWTYDLMNRCVCVPGDRRL